MDEVEQCHIPIRRRRAHLTVPAQDANFHGAPNLDGTVTKLDLAADVREAFVDRFEDQVSE